MLINASPDIRSQLLSIPLQFPDEVLRGSIVNAVILTDAQIDHSIGLLMLRESVCPLPVWCTESVCRDISRGNPLINVLSHFCGVNRQSVAFNEGFEIESLSDVQFTAFSLSSKPPPFSPSRAYPTLGDNIGLMVTDRNSGGRLFFAPGIGAWDQAVELAMNAADCVMVDGTFWSDSELVSLGVSTKSARDMGHMPLSGPSGMIEWLGELPSRTRKILVHVNNTNPIVDELSAERSQLTKLGIEVAYDGMEIEL